MSNGDGAQWVIAVASTALAFITLAYTVSTILLFTETRAARLDAARPALHLSPQILGVNYPVARVTNVGRGYAKNIRGDLWITVAEQEAWRYAWHMDLIAPGDHHDFILFNGDARGPELTAMDAAKEQRRFHMGLQFEDGLGHRWHVRGDADWSDVTEHLFGAQMLLKDDKIAKMEEHLNSIAKSLRDAVDTFDGVKVLTYRERSLKRAEERRSIEERQAKQDESGMPRISPEA